MRKRKRTGAPNRARGESYWIYGRHAVAAALANPRRTARRLVATEGAAPQGRVADITARIDIDRMLPPGAVHQGIALLVEPLPAVAIEEVADSAAARERAVVVVLDQVSDPQNVGAVLRSAAAFGALAVVVPDRHAPQESGALAKAAAGALEIVPLVRVANLARALDQLKTAGFWIAGLCADADQSIATAPLADRLGLVLGAEGSGLRRLTLERCDLRLRLPMAAAETRGIVDSLNVAAAAAVALYAATVRHSGLLENSLKEKE